MKIYEKQTHNRGKTGYQCVKSKCYESFDLPNPCPNESPSYHENLFAGSDPHDGCTSSENDTGCQNCRFTTKALAHRSSYQGKGPSKRNLKRF